MSGAPLTAEQWQRLADSAELLAELFANAARAMRDGAQYGPMQSGDAAALVAGLSRLVDEVTA